MAQSPGLGQFGGEQRGRWGQNQSDVTVNLIRVWGTKKNSILFLFVYMRSLPIEGWD